MIKQSRFYSFIRMKYIYISVILKKNAFRIQYVNESKENKIIGKYSFQQ